MTEKYEEVFSGILSEIKTIDGGKELFYEKNYPRIEVNTDDDLPLNVSLCYSRGRKIVPSNLFRWVFVWIVNARTNYWYISKNDAINIMNNFGLVDKMKVL